MNKRTNVVDEKNPSITKSPCFRLLSQVPELHFLSSDITNSYRNLCIIFDNNLNFHLHINSVVQSCFIQLRKVSKIWSFLSVKNLETVKSRFSYCSALSSCLTHQNLNKLQLIQTAAARLTTSSNRRKHITPAFKLLHRLPVRLGEDFKLLMITFKARRRFAPEYIAELLRV